jgi:hypothetical protein
LKELVDNYALPENLLEEIRRVTVENAEGYSEL